MEFDNLRPLNQHEALHGMRLKVYPTGQAEIMISERPVFRPDGLELRKESQHDISAALVTPDELADAAETVPAVPDSDSLDRNRRRARSKLREIALCSDLTHFATLTLDPAKIERFDADVLMPKVLNWCNHQVSRRDFAYVMVPERHKSGAIHFHALINGGLDLVDSGCVSLPGSKRPRRPRSDAQRAAWLEAGGHAVYNLPQWRWGFSSAIEMYGDYGRTINYVLKYISKGTERIGGRWYYSGGKLTRSPDVAYFDGPSPSELAALHDGSGRYVHSFSVAGCGFSLWRGQADEVGGLLHDLGVVQ
jgi:hypothetical protein